MIQTRYFCHVALAFGAPVATTVARETTDGRVATSRWSIPGTTPLGGCQPSTGTAIVINS